MWSALASVMILVGIIGLTGLGLLVKFWYIVVPIGFLVWLACLVPERKWREKRRQLAELVHHDTDEDSSSEATRC